MFEKPTKKDMDGSSGVAAIIFGAILFIMLFPLSEWTQHHGPSGNFGGFLILIAGLATLFGGPVLFFWGIWKVGDAKFCREKYESICAAEERIKKAEKEREKRRQAEEEKLKHEKVKRLKESEVDDDNKIKNDDNMFVKVYHLTSIDNVDSIKKEGILSRVEVERKGNYTDIAEHRALDNHRNIVIDGVALDNYARCFFNPLPPMYYNRKKEGEHLAIIELHIPVEKTRILVYGEKYNLKIDGAKYHFYKQSIASRTVNIEQLEVYSFNKISWDSDKSAYLDNRDGAIACRGAELLVYPKIPAKYIYKVHYCDNEINHELIKGSELGRPEIGNN